MEKRRVTQLDIARAAGVPLDAPTAPMDSSGSGVSGVDEAMGPVDLFAVPPAGDIRCRSRFKWA